MPALHPIARIIVLPRVVGLPGFTFLPTDVLVAFTQPGRFEAMLAAERWLASHGFSYGPCQCGGDPRGIKRGAIRIAKWRGLTEAHREGLDGIMLPPRGQLTMIRGPVAIRLRGDVAPAEPTEGADE